MRSQDFEMGGVEFSPLEQLLSEAATWEPDAPAPCGLAGKAMAAELERQDRERVLRGRERRAGLFTAFFMGASAVSATVALAFFQWSPPESATTAGGTQPPLAPSIAVATAVTGEGVRPIARTAPTSPGAGASRGRLRRLAGGNTIPGRRLPKRKAEAPTALWRDETVRHEVAGVLRSGWLIQQNPEDGSYIITPGVLDVQAGGQEACGETPMPGSETLAVPPPTLPQPSAPLEPVTENPNAPDAASGSPLENGEPPVPES